MEDSELMAGMTKARRPDSARAPGKKRLKEYFVAFESNLGKGSRWVFAASQKEAVNFVVSQQFKRMAMESGDVRQFGKSLDGEAFVTLRKSRGIRYWRFIDGKLAGGKIIA